MEVVHEGILEIGFNPNSKSSKDWKGRLFVLKTYAATGRSTLDYYKSTSKRWQKQSIMGTLSLWPEFEVSLAHQCPYKYTLRLTISDGTVYLASSNQSAMNKWLYHIQTQRFLNPTRDTYIYNVKAQESASMNMIGVFGECQLALTPKFEIVCALNPTQQIAAVWPLDCLRNFSYGGGIFSFEAGRQSPQGPGEYEFLTNHDHLIHGRLVKMVDKFKRNSYDSSKSSNSSTRISSMMDHRPPAQLPIQDRESSSDSVGSDSDESLQKQRKDHSSETSPAKTFPPPLPDVPPPKIPPKGLTSPDPMFSHNPEQPVDNVERFFQSNQPQVPQDESGDHVYSHTVHSSANYPPTTSDDDPQIYNSLVHEGKSKKKANAYEVAYPQPKTSAVPKEGSSDIVYDTAYTDTDGPAPHRQEPSLANIPPSNANTDGMTANPLYGSQGNLLEDIMSNQVFNITTTPESSSPPLPPKPKSLSTSPPELSKLPEPSHPDITANPVYITSANVQELTNGFSNSQSPGMNGHSPPIQSNSPPIYDQELKENENSINIIKGYSRVTKHITEDGFVPGSMDSDPPPIPERQGSFNDD